MVATSRTFEFLFDASTARMATGLQAGKHGLDELTEEANKADVALRAIPDKVDVGFGISEGSAAKLRAGLLAEKAKIEASLTDINVDVDTKKATTKLALLDRKLKALDRLDVRPEVHVDVDRGVAGAVIAMEGIAGGMRSIGSAGPIAAAGIVAVAAAAGLAIAPAALGGLSAALVGGGAYSLLSAYDELEKGNKRFAVVFGDQADIVDEWARALSDRVGVGVEDLKGMASSIQDILVPIGFNRQDAADITTQLYERGAALAEFTGKDVSTAIDAITKGLTGERESLKQFGIVLKEEQVSARIEVLKGTAAAKGLDDQQLKALATMELIEEQSKDAWSAYQDGTNDAGKGLNTLAAKFATAKDDIILGLGQIAVGIMNDLDFGGMADGLDDIPQWINTNSAQIREFFLTLADMALAGADAFLSLAGAIIDMAVASAPVLKTFSSVMGFASANTLRLAAAAAALSGKHDVAASFINAANSAQEFANSSGEALDKLIGFGAQGRSGIDGARQGIQGIRDDLAELRISDEQARIDIKVAVESGNVSEIKRVLGTLTKSQVALILAELPEENRTKAEKRLARLARKRKAEITAEANTNQAWRDLDDAAKDRYTTIWGKFKWETGASPPGWDGGYDKAPWQQSLDPGPAQGGGGTTVILDGYRVATAIAERTSIQHREVWV